MLHAQFLQRSCVYIAALRIARHFGCMYASCNKYGVDADSLGPEHAAREQESVDESVLCASLRQRQTTACFIFILFSPEFRNSISIVFRNTCAIVT